MQSNGLVVRTFLKENGVKSILHVEGDDHLGADFRFYLDTGNQQNPAQFFQDLLNSVAALVPKKTKHLGFVPPKRRSGNPSDRVLSAEDCKQVFGYESRKDEELAISLISKEKEILDIRRQTLLILNGLRAHDPQILSIFQELIVDIKPSQVRVTGPERPEPTDQQKLEFLAAESTLQSLRKEDRRTHSRVIVKKVLDQYFDRIGLEHLGWEVANKRVRSRMGYNLKRFQGKHPAQKREETNRLQNLIDSFISSHLQ